MLRRFSLRQVSLGAMGLLAIVACAGMLGMALTADSLRREVMRQNRELREEEQAAGRIVHSAHRQVDATHRYAITRDTAEIERFRADGMGVYDEIRGYLFRDLGRDERLLVENIRERHELIEVAAQRVFAGNDRALIELPELAALEDDLSKLIEFRTATHNRIVAQQQRWWRLLYVLCLVIGLFFLLTLAFAMDFLRQRLLEPLAQLSGAARSVGAGNFFARVDVQGADELAAVAGSFNRMAEQLDAAQAGAAAASAALRDSEQRYHSLFEGVPIGLYRTSPAGEFLDVNPAMVRILGYASREQLLATNADDTWVDVTDRRRWTDAVLEADGASVETDRQQLRADGSVIWVRDIARVVRGSDGEIRYFEGALKDVTERVQAVAAMRHSEARFRSLVENASEGVLIVGADRQLRYLTPSVVRMLGRSPDGCSAEALLVLVHPEDRADVTQTLVALAATAGSSRSVEFRFLHEDGRWRVLHAVGTNLVHDPAVEGYVVNLIDLTSHRQLEEQLQHSLKMEAVGRLAGGIAHDFNNLLTAIRGYTDLLALHAGGMVDVEPDVDEIRRAVDRGSRLTRQLLAFSRRQVVRRRPVCVGTLIAELKQMLGRMIPEHTMIDTDLADDCWVHADPGQLEQVIMNLVVNAADAGPRSGIRIRVAACTLNGEAERVAPGEYVRIIVQDDGCGIPASVLPFVFEPFFTTKEIGKGTGLGLSTVYGIARDSGGSVVIDSTSDDGTTISVYLRRVRAPVAEAPPAAMRALVPGTAMVLLVEDEPAVRAIAHRVLQRHGHTVIAASNGEEALAVAAAHVGAIDLLVTDVVMPAMGGVQLARELIRIRPGLKILFMSGYAPDELPVGTGGLPSHFIEKPFSPADLAAAVARVLTPADPVPV